MRRHVADAARRGQISADSPARASAEILAGRLGRALRLNPLSNEAARAEMLATTPAE
jgi:hypothetical protein